MMDEFERDLVRRLGDGGASAGDSVRYEAAIADARRRRGLRRWGVAVLGLMTAGAVLTLGFVLAARVLPTPDNVGSAMLWTPPAAVALLVFGALHEMLRAVR